MTRTRVLGLIAVPQIGAPPQHYSVGVAIEDILIVTEVAEPKDLEGQVIYLPL